MRIPTATSVTADNAYYTERQPIISVDIISGVMASVFLAATKSVYAEQQASHDLLFKLCRKHPYGQFVEDGKSYNNMWKIKQILEEHPHLVSNKEAIPGGSGKTA